jgi:hypothetical protein
MSHRKYAEMYFFYKFYLLNSKKRMPKDAPQIDFQPLDGFNFNTHVRLFFDFLERYSWAESSFLSLCKNEKEHSICQTWDILSIILKYIRSPISKPDLLDDIFKNYTFEKDRKSFWNLV